MNVKAKKTGQRVPKQFGSVSQESWTNQSIIKCLRPHLPKLRQSAGLVLDGAGLHGPVRQWLIKNRVKILPLPAYTPWFNLIEHTWQNVKWQASLSEPKNLAGLRVALLKAYRAETKAIISKTYFSLANEAHD